MLPGLMVLSFSLGDFPRFLRDLSVKETCNELTGFSSLDSFI
jgi:hypothetical protein